MPELPVRATSRQPGQEPAVIQIRIEASGLPGRDWRPAGQADSSRTICVGVQSRKGPGDLLSPHPVDAASAVWTFAATAVPLAAGIDITGPYIHGRRGDRFIYLTWGSFDDTGAFTMFIRTKLMLGAVDSATVEAARRDGRLIARLSLTGAAGRPLAASVRPPLIDWSASAAG